MGLRERRHPLQASRYQPSRLGAVPLGQGEQHTGHVLARLGKVGLLLRAGRVLRGQVLADGEAGPVFGQRPSQVALGYSTSPTLSWETETLSCTLEQ
jgi:hypothetical protein